MPDSSNRLKTRIPGWGADLDLKNRPGVPRIKAPHSVNTGAHWGDPPEKQKPRFRIHKSTEHPELTATFGTSCPPKGLSGLMRTFAYSYSESKIQRWLILLAADRIDMVEGTVSELLRGRPDNPFSEMGLRAEFEQGAGLSRLRRSRAGIRRRWPLLVLVGGVASVALSASHRRERAA